MSIKLLPIRNGPRHRRPIWAIGYPKAGSDGHRLEARDPCPTHKFITSARTDYPDDWRELLALLEDVATNGPPRARERFNSLGNGIFEFKTWHLRLLCFFEADSIIVCTHGFYKQSQRTPRREIQRAIDSMNHFKRAKLEGEISYG